MINRIDSQTAHKPAMHLEGNVTHLTTESSAETNLVATRAMPAAASKKGIF